MPDEVLATDRLRLEPWGERHTALLVRLSANPDVMRFIGDGSVWPASRAEEVAVANREHWHRHGFGWRAALDRATGEAIGFSALNFAGEESGVDAAEYEIGWWLDPATWGRGLAREGATAIRDEGFERMGAPSLVARIQPTNTASLGVARALGLKPESESRGRGGEPIVVLRLTAERWRRLVPPRSSRFASQP